MSADFPRSEGDVARWCEASGRTAEEGKRRFAQYCILFSIASHRTARSLLVLKGGNALDFVWSPGRSTLDLDFSVTNSTGVDEKRVGSLLTDALRGGEAKHGTSLRLQRVKQNPPGADKTFITFDVSVGYALPSQPKIRQTIQDGKPSSQAIQLDISLNEAICASQAVPLDVRETVTLVTSTPEDIVAEKLRSLLQQKPRRRNRPQDVLDIAAILDLMPGMDRAKIGAFFVTKCEGRGIVPSKEAFREPEIQERAERGYAELWGTSRRFVAFDRAWASVVGLVDELEIPEAGTDPVGDGSATAKRPAG